MFILRVCRLLKHVDGNLRKRKTKITWNPYLFFAWLYRLNALFSNSAVLGIIFFEGIKTGMLNISLMHSIAGKRTFLDRAKHLNHYRIHFSNHQTKTIQSKPMKTAFNIDKYSGFDFDWSSSFYLRFVPWTQKFREYFHDGELNKNVFMYRMRFDSSLFYYFLPALFMINIKLFFKCLWFKKR